MSDLARLTVDLARRLGAERVVALGCGAPQRLAEIAARLPLTALDAEPRLAALGERAPDAELVAWQPGAELPASVRDAAPAALVVCDGLLDDLDDVDDVDAALGALAELVERAPAALVSVADRDLTADDSLAGGSPGGEAPRLEGARWSAGELRARLEAAGMPPAWTGLSDASGPVGRRAGVTCALSTTRLADLHGALAGGPLGLGFDPAAAGPPGERAPRVCIASYEFVGPTRTGGIGTAYTSLAETLAAAGQQVTVLFTGWEEENGEPFSRWVGRYRLKGIELRRLPPPTATWIETGHRHAVRAYEAYRWLRDRDGSFDVIHFPEVLGHGYYAIEARRLGVAFAETTIAVGTHSSTSWVLESNGTVFQALDDFADDFIERCCVERCDALISPSAYMLDWMRARGWRLPERHFVQQYARSGAVAGPQPTPEPQAHDGGPTEIVFFGRLEPRKGLGVFCDALDLLAAERSECTITFLGKRSTIDGLDAAEYIERRREPWPWPTQVIDDLGQPEAVAYLRAPGRRMTVIPSLADNSPNTVYEALALEIPFIASRVGGTAELIDPRDRARSTFDPMSGMARSDPRGAEALADRLREALRAETLAAPRPAISAEACRAAHVRWHRRVSAAGGRAAPEPPESSQLGICVVGTDDGRLAASRRSIEAQDRAPAQVREVAEHAAAAPNTEQILFMPAGAQLAAGAVATLEAAMAAAGSEVIAITVSSIDEEGERVQRVPVGGPPVGGLLRRCFGDAAFAIRRATLDRVGGADPGVEPGMQAHHLLCRLAIAGVEIDVLPEPILGEAPPDALAPISIVDASRRRQGIIDAYRGAPASVLAELPLLTQQLYVTAEQRERALVALYEHRFGRLTLPIRRTMPHLRRMRRLLSARASERRQPG